MTSNQCKIGFEVKCKMEEDTVPEVFHVVHHVNHVVHLVVHHVHHVVHHVVQHVVHLVVHHVPSGTQAVFCCM